MRASRTQLVVPANNVRFVAKAAASQADVILLDLEDSVAVADKPAARDAAVEALRTMDFGHRCVSVRINALDTPFMYRDLINLAENGGHQLDLIMIPKVESAADVHLADVLLGQIEAATGRESRIGLEAQIETARGLQNVESIAAASPRLESLHFGPGDFAASIGARTTSIGGTISEYGILSEGAERRLHLADPWHYAHARMVVAARAAGLRPMDGPYADFNDHEGLVAAARRSAALGFEGKWAIHPRQLDEINAAFTPDEAEVAQAQAIMQALKAAQSHGRGAVVLDGRMIDAASVRQAKVTLARAASRSEKA